LAVVPDVVFDLGSLRRIVQWGVAGIITVRDGSSQFRSAVEAVYRRTRWLSPVIGGYLLDKLLLADINGPPAADFPTRPKTLTECERSVVKLVPTG